MSTALIIQKEQMPIFSINMKKSATMSDMCTSMYFLTQRQYKEATPMLNTR